ncbi:MAG: superoxide dismutase [Woeseiaceae bacterium]
MTLALPPLPYDYDGLQPFISAATLKLHHGVHHRGYLERVAVLVRGTPLEGQPLEAIIRRSAFEPALRSLRNSAAQAWNHAFLWQSLRPAASSNVPTGSLASRIASDFGGQRQFADAFGSAALAHFGSGWVWLLDRDGRLRIEATANADNPLGRGGTPLLVVDVWEHAYYLDYQARRGDYVAAVLEHLLDWDFAARNLAREEAVHD